jgi:hypothetical protein
LIVLFRRHQPFVCRQAVGLMTNYRDGALSRQRSRAPRGPSRALTQCSDYLAQIKLVVDTAGHVEPDDVSPRRSTISSRCIADGRLNELMATVL